MPSGTTETAVLKRLRKICLSLPEVVETNAWGHPNFKAGKKMFAALDHYKGHSCIALKAEREHQAFLVKDPRFFVAPYGGNLGWVCLKTDSKLNWDEVEELILASYRLVALRRMIDQLDARKGGKK